MKKLFTLLMIALAAFTTKATVTFHVTPNSATQTPYLYVWNDNGNDGGWPGTKMTAVGDGTFTGTTSKTGSVNFIINNGNGNKTADIKNTGIKDGADIYITVKDDWSYDINIDNHDGTVVDPDPDMSLYVLGNLKEGAWNPSIGVEMVHAIEDGIENNNEFVCTIKLTAESSYFSFTTTLANSSDWSEINGKGYRYGATASNTPVVLNNETTVAEFPLRKADTGTSFAVPGGVYSIKVILVNGVPSKMQIAKGYNNSVITAVNDVDAVKNVAGVRYYNLQGMQSAEPFSGINIMVTNYTDGTTSTAKVIR